jgi:hypothetical protein
MYWLRVHYVSESVSNVSLSDKRNQQYAVFIYVSSLIRLNFLPFTQATGVQIPLGTP